MVEVKIDGFKIIFCISDLPPPFRAERRSE